MPGTVLEIKVQVGDEVSAGQILVVVEAMKMELPVKAPAPGRIQEVLVNVGDSVAQGKSLVVLSEDEQNREERNQEEQND
jgi:biotin carboxyl carrier protein